jgi:hypothetical protein
LTIQPLPCDFTEELNADYVCTDEVVTIYNKNRELFEINVPSELHINNIKIDSLDSILYSLSVLSDSCIDERSQCCQMSDEGVISTIDGSSSDCEDAIAEYLESLEAKCLVNQPRSLFKMQLDPQGEV